MADNPSGPLKGALAGQEDTFRNAGMKWGVDPNLMMSIAMFETGNGSSHAVNAYNNVGGLMDPSTPQAKGFSKFKTVGDSIDYLGQTLRTGYLDQGLTTIPQIAAKYSPPGAANDPNKTNAEWPAAVSANYNKLVGTQPSWTPIESGEPAYSAGAPDVATAIKEQTQRAGGAISTLPTLPVDGRYEDRDT